MLARIVASTAILALVWGLSVTPALADGDPASDVLATQAYFLPSDAGLSAQKQAELVGLLGAAQRTGYSIRVAVVASPTDLGSVTALWGQPERYAQFLGVELSLIYKGQLLVVMPQGFGVENPAKPLAAQAAALSGTPAPGSSAALGSAALTAIGRLGAAAGHPLAAPTPAPLASRAGPPDAAPWIAFLVGAALVAAAWAASLRARPLGRRAQAS